jgi:Fe-S cluster assembly protein SufB
VADLLSLDSEIVEMSGGHGFGLGERSGITPACRGAGIMAAPTMKYPSIYLLGDRAHGEVLSIAFAGAGQHQDAAAKIIHAAPNTTSNTFAKSISKEGGRSSYRGLLEIAKGAHGFGPRSCATHCCSTSMRARTPTRRSGSATTSMSDTRRPSRGSARSSSFYLMSHGIRED